MAIDKYEKYLEEEKDEYDVYHIPNYKRDDFYNLVSTVAIRKIRAGIEIEYDVDYRKITVYHNDDNIERHANKYVEFTETNFTIDNDWADKSIDETYDVDYESIVNDAAQKYYNEHSEEDNFINSVDDAVMLYNDIIDEFRMKCIKCESRILGDIILKDRMRRIEPDIEPDGRVSEEVLDLAYVYIDAFEPTLEDRLEKKMPIYKNEIYKNDIDIEDAESVVITEKNKTIQEPNQDEFNNIIVKPNRDPKEYAENLRENMKDTSLKVHRSGDLVHIWTFEPIYLRDPPDEDCYLLKYHNVDTDTVLEFDEAKPKEECDKKWEIYKDDTNLGVVDVRGIEYEMYKEVMGE